MGCNCGKKKPEPQPTPLPKTVEEMVIKELNVWNGGPQPIPKEDNWIENNYPLIED